MVQEARQVAPVHKDKANWSIQTNVPICVVAIGDWHMGSWGTDYDLSQACTEEIINTPNLYVIIVGDMLQMAIKLRGVLEVSDNALLYWHTGLKAYYCYRIEHLGPFERWGPYRMCY